MRILISAGPTREYLDTVRFLSNPSSGRMGYALARAARARGHEVILVSGPVDLPPPPGVAVIRVTSAAEMARACRQVYRRADAAIMTAAVCDYRPVVRAVHKVPKRRRRFRLTLEPTEDIAASLGRIKGRRLLVGFALEDHDGHRHAEQKLRRKYCDLIVLNHPSHIGTADTTIQTYSPTGGWSPPMHGPKAVVARKLIRMIEDLEASRRSGKSPRSRIAGDRA